MRPQIKIAATQTVKNEVYVQLSNELFYFGGLTMPMKEYVALRDTILQGAMVLGGDAGIEPILEESGFGTWK